MIWDVFCFSGELDMLECRLRELEHVPSLRHVIIESPVDHQGHEKPLYFCSSGQRFAPWRDRIIHTVTDLPRNETTPWARIRAQRHAAWRVLDHAAPSDTVLVADVDEIPAPLAAQCDPVGLVAFEQRVLIYAVDWDAGPQLTTVACRAGDLRDLTDARDQRYFCPVVRNAGWHMSWFGGPKAISKKLTEFCHTELADTIGARNAAGDCYERGWTWFGTGQATPVEVGEGWPRWVREGKCPSWWYRPRTPAALR